MRQSHPRSLITLWLLAQALASGGGCASPGTLVARPGVSKLSPTTTVAADAPHDVPARTFKVLSLPAHDPMTSRAAATSPADGIRTSRLDPEDEDADLRLNEDVDRQLDRPRAQKRGEGGGPTRVEEEAEEDEVDGYIKPDLLNRMTSLRGSRVSLFGWVQGSFTANPGNRVDGTNFGVNPNDLANAWQFEQIYLVAERRLVETDGVDFGFRFDNLFGTDWQNFHDVGFLNHAFRVDRPGYEPVQLYGDVHLPILTSGGLDVRGGRFYALPGYEDGIAPGRPLLSTGYLFSYGQPMTHVGVMTTLHLTDQINLYNGAINGWDRWINEHYKWGYSGGLSWDSKDERTNLTMTVTLGPDQISADPAMPEEVARPLRATRFHPSVPGESALGFGGKSTGLLDAVLVHEWTERLSTVLEGEDGFQNAVPGLGPRGRPRNASWYGLSGWSSYDLTDRLTWVVRAEAFRDQNGVRTGFDDTFYEATTGLIYRPRPWLMIRPETRFDWAQKGHPYNDGRSRDQFTFGFDTIILF